MSNFLRLIGGSFVLSIATVSFVNAQETQTTTTKTTTVTESRQNPDGSYTVVEYPVGKEVVVDLTPSATLPGAKGTARIMRSADGTTINLDLSGVAGDSQSFNVYAVDPTGAMTSLGQVSLTNGTGTASLTTPLDKFMLVLSPEAGLTAVNNTKVVLRSAVPTGYAVVPVAKAADEKQVASSVKTKAYNAPLLGIPSLTGDTEIRVKFSGELQGLKGKAYINPRKDGATQIKMRFDDMKLAPKGDKRFVLWTVSPDNKYVKVGQVINTGERQEAEIRGETALKDFGLFVTMEDSDVTEPTGGLVTEFGNQ